MPSDHNRTDPRRARAIAFAALVQSAYLVDGLARKGVLDSEDFDTAVRSILTENTAVPEDVYGGLRHLHTGLHLGIRMLKGGELSQARAIVSYGTGLLRLERSLSKAPQILGQVAAGIARARVQADYFGSITHASLIANLASLYGETLSTIKPRIIVQGKAEYLSQAANTDKMRTLLLAGIRAAHLWRASGGNRLHLLFGRKRLLADMGALLKESHHH